MSDAIAIAILGSLVSQLSASRFQGDNNDAPSVASLVVVPGSHVRYGHDQENFLPPSDHHRNSHLMTGLKHTQASNKMIKRISYAFHLFSQFGISSISFSYDIIS